MNCCTGLPSLQQASASEGSGSFAKSVLNDCLRSPAAEKRMLLMFLQFSSLKSPFDQNWTSAIVGHNSFSFSVPKKWGGTVKKHPVTERLVNISIIKLPPKIYVPVFTLSFILFSMQNNQVAKFSHGESEACMQMDLDQTHGWGPWHRQKVWIVSLHTKLKLACVCVWVCYAPYIWVQSRRCLHLRKWKRRGAWSN